MVACLQDATPPPPMAISGVAISGAPITVPPPPPAKVIDVPVLPLKKPLLPLKKPGPLSLVRVQPCSASSLTCALTSRNV